MAPNATANNRSAERSPSGESKRGKRGGNRGRKRKPAIHRIQEDAADRQELWQRGDSARARDREPRVPTRIQVGRLTDSLGQHFDDRRDDRAGTIPLPPATPETMRESNLRARKPPKRRARGE